MLFFILNLKGFKPSMLSKLLNYTQIYNLWLSRGATEDAAKDLALQQIDSFEEIVNDDKSWNKLLEIATRGRNEDAWLAVDWPSGFDELLLCVPLCKLVDWECCKCTIGKRQENHSCAFDYSIFGHIGMLVKNADRRELKKHLVNLRKMLKDERYIWNVHKCELELLKL